ncbi:signal peptidase I [Paenibacillaceae bacterium GAS479]|nr:signal peptidase I [Paenibacillaceae bacterium GAS479]
MKMNNLDGNLAPMVAALLDKRGSMELTSFGMSMYPLIQEGDVSRFVRVRAQDLEVGDICLFVSSSGILTGHRLVEIRDEESRRQYVFRGDTSYIADEPVAGEAILGLWTGVKRKRSGSEKMTNGKRGSTGLGELAAGSEKIASGKRDVSTGIGVQAAGSGKKATRGGSGAIGELAADGAGARSIEPERDHWLTPKHWRARLIRLLMLHLPIARKFTRKLGNWSMSRKPMYRAQSR